MCGIAGIINKKGNISDDLIIKMRDTFPYRGPDDKGVWINNNKSVALGHRRLSIIDTSSAGRQPMGDNTQSTWITYNGEVYNYIELKRTLQEKGYKFKTGTDTEVILASFREWGSECLPKFNGMWAFAIWDEANKKLFLARDRLGIKPLYYFQNEDAFYFASEVKAILAVLNERPEIVHSLIDSYMSFGYIPGENTLFEGIKRLLPGHYMIISDEGVTISKYWDLCFSNQKDMGLNYYVNKAQNLLESAIDLRLRSDVPLGIFLSGGLDSSAVVGLLANRVPDRLKTFSVAYDFGQDFNETDYARIIARQFNTDHHEIFVTPRQFQEFIPDYVRLMDEPVTESAAISLYFVSQLAKKHVTVVLSGEGADEVFAGYDLYRYMLLLEKYRCIAGDRIAGLLGNLSNAILPDGNKIRKYLSFGAFSLEQRYKGISTYEESIKRSLYLDEFANLLQNEKNRSAESFLLDLFNSTKNNDVLSRMLFNDTKTWLVDDLLIKADRMSMAASLELRVPFLDYRLVEFAASLPSKYKINRGINKYLLKKMMTNVLPKEIIHRKKMGFPTPLKIMFQNELSAYASNILLDSSSRIHNYFDKKVIEKLLDNHIRKIQDNHRIIWQLLVLEIWMQTFQKK